MASNGELEDAFTYSRAVVCGGVSTSLPEAALRLEEPEQVVDLERARRQHEEYVQVWPSAGSVVGLC